MASRRSAATFWDHVAPLLAAGDVEEGTLMGFPCLRAKGQFLAVPEFGGEGLIVKLSQARVEALIAEGTGQPCAPAGRAFREWVLIPAYDPELWTALLAEGRAFVTK